MLTTATITEPSIYPLSATETITFEQPLNESIRICLRLENLFNHFRDHLDPTGPNPDYALLTLLKIINFIDRPDIRSKISQTLTQYAGGLTQLTRFNHVDQTRLQILIAKIDQLNASLHQNQHKIGDGLKRNTLLNYLRLQLSNPGGIALHKNPALRLWQERSCDNKICDLKEWAEAFKDLNSCVVLILELIRQTSTSQAVVALGGVYQRTLDSTLPCELVRITLDRRLQVYPEVSFGRHRISLRFIRPEYFTTGQHPKLQEDIAFTICCCRI